MGKTRRAKDENISFALGDELIALGDALKLGITHSPLSALLRLLEEICLLIRNLVSDGVEFETPRFEFVPTPEFLMNKTEFVWEREERSIGPRGNVIIKDKRSIEQPTPEAPYLNGVPQEGREVQIRKIISTDNSNIEDFMEFIIRATGQYLLNPAQDLEFVPPDQGPNLSTSTKLNRNQYWFYKRAQHKRSHKGQTYKS